MFAHFQRYRALHGLMALLDTAIRSTRPNDATALEECLQRIAEICRSGPQTTCTISLSVLRDAVMQVLCARKDILPTKNP